MGDCPSPLARTLSPALADRLRRMPVVVVTGARQTGKSTLVRALPEAPPRRYENLDSLGTLDRARNAPESLVGGADRVTFDEIQRAPDLLLAIKESVDASRKPGRFLLTGSANLLLLPAVGESLAGRAAHLVLRPLTEREKRREPESAPWGALLGAGSADEALACVGRCRDLDWKRAALAGGLPPAALADDIDDRIVWFDGYVDTYLHRDLRDVARVDDVAAFGRLLRLAALRTGGLLNVTDLARDAAVPRTSAQRWTSILAATHMVTLLQPFGESRARRLIKSPKLYSMDTGLSLHACGVTDPAGIDALPNAGAWLENLVLNDVLAWRDTQIRRPEVTFRRTASGEEVDFVLESGRRLLPIEVRGADSVRVADAKAVDAFCAEFGARAPFGIVAYSGRAPHRLTSRTVALPLGALL
ncbi:MAG: hypothetical protein HMLKMBBP_02681 [Planctomycetes bacterium]|nr:hypothetical protein [Planctomycetota bacterium]